MDNKYNIGDEVFFVESSCNFEKSIPCPMCFGKKFVVIILGNDERTKIECGFCGHGYNRATGTAKTWEPNAVIYKKEISGITTRNGIKYEVGYRSLSENELYNSREDAETEREKRYKIEVERSEKYFKDNFINAKKNQIWSAGYHKRCIKDAKRTIEWHELRLGMIKEQAVNRTSDG